MISAERWAPLEERYGQSPLHRALGLRLRIVGTGRAQVEYLGGEAGANRRGIVAGGTLATMIDSAAMQAIRTMLDDDQDSVTLSMNVNYIRAAEPGVLRAEGEVVHVGSRTAVGTTTVSDGAGRVVALGTVTAALLTHAVRSHAIEGRPASPTEGGQR